MKSFSFKDKNSFLDYGFYITSITQEIIPGTSDIYTTIPNKPGSLLFPGAPNDRIITVGCAFINSTLGDIRTRARAISNWIYSEIREDLIFSHEPGVKYLAKIADATDLKEGNVFQEFTLTFKSDPFAYSVIEYAPTFSGSKSLSYAGMIEIYPLFSITLSGAVSNLTIQNALTGESFVITGMLSSGDKIEVDGGYKTVKTAKINGQNALHRFSGNWIKLQNGNNTILGSNSNASITMKYREKWI